MTELATRLPMFPLMEPDTGVTILIPTHNEGPRIEPVLETAVGLKRIGQVDDILVVIHNTDDNTAEVVAKFDGNIRHINADTPGRGKDFALMAGFTALGGGVKSYFHLDADIRGMTLDYGEGMLELFHRLNDTHVVVSPLRHDRNPGHYRFNDVAGGLSGQRIVPADLVLGMPFAGLEGWGYEIKVTLEAIRRQRLAVMADSGVLNVDKLDKYGPRGRLANREMYKSVGLAVLKHVFAWTKKPSETVAQRLGLQKTRQLVRVQAPIPGVKLS